MEPGEGPCPPDEFMRRLKDRRTWGLVGWASGIPGALLLLWAVGVGGRSGRVYLAVLLGLLLWCGALAAYARCKGRGMGWGLLGLGCVPALIVIRLLPPSCGWCGRPDSKPPLHCRTCGGPI
jgi:hypothetical protein